MSALHGMSCYIGPRYDGTRLHIESVNLLTLLCRYMVLTLDMRNRVNHFLVLIFCPTIIHLSF